MIDPASLAISCSTLAFTMGTFTWQHLRKVDALICTFVARQPVTAVEVSESYFQLSIANLGTRAALLQHVGVNVYKGDGPTGMYSGTSQIVDEKLPRVIQPGDICSVTVRSHWTREFASHPGLILTNETEQQRESRERKLTFAVNIVAWNPKGKRFFDQRIAATLIRNPEGNGWQFRGDSDEPFRIKRG